MFFDVNDIPLTWCNDIPVTQEDLLRIMLLRVAGCPCHLPLLGQHDIGNGLYVPRCRMCGTEIRLA